MAGWLSSGRGGGGGGAEGGRRELNVQDAAGWRVPESVINDSSIANEELDFAGVSSGHVPVSLNHESICQVELNDRQRRRVGAYSWTIS